MNEEPASRPFWHRFASTAATQISFSGSSILATVALSELSGTPKSDLAFLGGVLLMQGLIRVVVGLNLGISGRSSGALFPALAVAALGGVAYSGLGYGQWCVALLLAVPFEMARTILARTASPRAHLVVVAADVAWLVPIVTILLIEPQRVGTMLAIGAGFGFMTCLTAQPVRSAMIESVALSSAWVTTTWGSISRSLAEASTGLAIPFAVVAVLTAQSNFDDVNALRASAQAVSPVGSAVALFVLRWPELDERRRRLWSHILVAAPLALPALAAVIPGVFDSLSADSPEVMPYAFGWAAFGCIQSRMAIAHADRRAGLQSRLPPTIIVAGVATGFATCALVTSNRTATAVALSVVVGAPIAATLIGHRTAKAASQRHQRASGGE